MRGTYGAGRASRGRLAMDARRRNNGRHRSGGAEWKDEEYPMRIMRTPCNIGGERAACGGPLRRRHLRLPVLLPARLCQFTRGCRWACYRRADRLRARLGWEPGILNGECGKPKWMRWRTFERLAAEHDDFVGESLAEMALRFGIKF
jgi:hypothetical protein